MKSFLVFVTITTAIAGLLYGCDTGIISGALLQISSQFHIQNTTQELVTSAILVGALTCGWTFQKLGRRMMILVLA